jgi:hypothetical protein
MLKNLLEAPFTPYGSRKKQFLDLLFGIVGTAFGVSNRIEVERINTIIAKKHSQDRHDGRYLTTAQKLVIQIGKYDQKCRSSS